MAPSVSCPDWGTLTMQHAKALCFSFILLSVKAVFHPAEKVPTAEGMITALC